MLRIMSLANNSSALTCVASTARQFLLGPVSLLLGSEVTPNNSYLLTVAQQDTDNSAWNDYLFIHLKKVTNSKNK